jgi:ubiquinone biosynthesis protein
MLSIRKIGVLGRTYRHLNRYRKILAIFFKYGYGDLIELLKIDHYIEVGLEMISRKRRDRIARLSRAERIRMALEELGPTYIKLGQALSTRPDLIAVDFVVELAKLQDKVPPRPFEEIKATVEKELGAPLDQLFTRFNEVSLAAASIGQVHRARLLDGEEVAIKVQHAGIKKTIEVDLEIMLHMATLMERNIEEIAPYRPIKIVEEFARTLEKEIDYTIEATSMERFRRQFLDDPHIYVPKVFRATSTERVLTMEYIKGVKVSDLEGLAAAEIDPKIITSRGAELWLKQVFDHGFFHADPHPGNLFALPDNVICLLDFGMMSSLDRYTKEIFVEIIDSVVNRDETKAVQTILRLTSYDDEPDIRILEREVADFMGQHLYKPLKDIEFGKLLQDLLRLVSQHRLRMPPNIFLMLKSFATMEGVARMLDPEFNMVLKAAPFIRRVKLARFLPHHIAAELYRYSGEMIEFLQQMPRDILEINRLIRQRRLTLRLEHQNLDNLLGVLHKISNRIAFAIVIAALLVGSALIVFARTPPLVYGISLIGIIGFLAAAAMGFWLLVAVLKKGL